MGVVHDVILRCRRDNGDHVCVNVKCIDANGFNRAADDACELLKEGFADFELESVVESEVYNGRN